MTRPGNGPPGVRAGLGTILVTGAAGFVGRHVARAFVTAGYRVVTVDRRTPPPDVSRNTDFRAASFDDPAVLDAVGSGDFAAVVHLAAISSTLEQDWPRLQRTNVDGPTELARRCAAGGARFVYASSSSVYGAIAERVPVPETALGSPLCSGPLNLYARSKALFDVIMLREFPPGQNGLAWAGLRFTNVFGGGDSHKKAMASVISQLLRRAARGEPLTVFADTLTACRDYIPVEDVADICLRVHDTPVPRGVYNLGSGRATSFAEVLEWCAEFSGAELPVTLIPNPYSDRYQYWTCADMAALDGALPERPRPGADDLKRSARSVFEEGRRHRRVPAL